MLITTIAAKGKVDDLESNIVKQGQYAKAAALQLDVGWEASPAILLSCSNHGVETFSK